MASIRPKVLLGFEDECITDKYKPLVNYTTNKIGGKPNWSVEGVPSPLCHLCGLALPLVLQIYAPLENSPYHRTLYLFGCINPNCWNQNESWVCIRSQSLETHEDKSDTLVSVNTLSATDWCADADEWEDDDNNANNNEENGNVIEVGRIDRCGDAFSDDEDEMEDFDDDGDETVARFGNLRVGERNANDNACGFGNQAGAVPQGAGAVGRLNSPPATAELEGDESEVVSIDTPTAPQHDLLALLQEVTPLPSELCAAEYTDKNGCFVPAKVAPPQFVSLFVNVGEEVQDNAPSPMQEHVRELWQEYQQNSEEEMGLGPDKDKRLVAGHGDNPTLEKYEKGIPAHGDWMFHEFLSRIQSNPGQLMRYCREGSPLPLAPIHNPPTRCQYCRSEMLFELQVLPTLISKLTLQSQRGQGSHLEFGTVLVYTCQRSCWSSGDKARQEAVVVQAERI